jgi:PAS domain S-box-containing protein
VNANERVNILIAGKQTTKLASYEVMLRELGENFILASSAEEALQCLLQTDVAVLLLDVDRLERDAFSTPNAILQHSNLQKTPIIFLLDGPLTDLDQCKEYRRGAVDFISAPVVPELLRNKVAIFADFYRKARQLETLTRELDLLSEAVIVSDGDGHIEFWNTGAEALYGCGREEVLGKNLDQVLPTTFPAAPEEVASTLISAGQWEGTVRRRHKGGQEICVALRKILQHSDGAGAGAVLEMGHDISAQLQAEEALRQSERLAAIGRLAGVIAHEINNPLETIANALFLVRSHPSLKGEAQRFARIAEEEVARIQHITQQTLSFYRESRTRISVSIQTVLDDVLDLQARRLQINQIAVEREYRDDMVIMGFPTELKQVFLNLIGNATQAMPQGGRLRISIRESTDHASSLRGIRVSVCDTGSGILPKDAKRLFEPFFTTKPSNGTGLGLWVSKGIIEKYQGTIRFRSLRLSDQHVTCFAVFIPEAVAASPVHDAVCA